MIFKNYSSTPHINFFLSNTHTTAGVGVDYASIRYTIHAGYAYGQAQYAQQSGRWRRDRERPAVALLLAPTTIRHSQFERYLQEHQQAAVSDSVLGPKAAMKSQFLLEEAVKHQEYVIAGLRGELVDCLVQQQHVYLDRASASCLEQGDGVLCGTCARLAQSRGLGRAFDVGIKLPLKDPWEAEDSGLEYLLSTMDMPGSTKDALSISSSSSSSSSDCLLAKRDRQKAGLASSTGFPDVGQVAGGCSSVDTLGGARSTTAGEAQQRKDRKRPKDDDRSAAEGGKDTGDRRVGDRASYTTSLCRSTFIIFCTTIHIYYIYDDSTLQTE